MNRRNITNNPDYVRLSLISKLAIENEVTDLVHFLAISHNLTSGFTYLNDGLFCELSEVVRNGSTIEDIVSSGISYWKNNINSSDNFDNKYNTIVPKSLYTNINIRNEVLNMYNELFNEVK